MFGKYCFHSVQENRIAQGKWKRNAQPLDCTVARLWLEVTAGVELTILSIVSSFVLCALIF